MRNRHDTGCVAPGRGCSSQSASIGRMSPFAFQYRLPSSRLWWPGSSPQMRRPLRRGRSCHKAYVSPVMVWVGPRRVRQATLNATSSAPQPRNLGSIPPTLSKPSRVMSVTIAAVEGAGRYSVTTSRISAVTRLGRAGSWWRSHSESMRLSRWDVFQGTISVPYFWSVSSPETSAGGSIHESASTIRKTSPEAFSYASLTADVLENGYPVSVPTTISASGRKARQRFSSHRQLRSRAVPGSSRKGTRMEIMSLFLPCSGGLECG